VSRILVVDDNEDIRELFRLILEDEGYSVVDVETGEDAIRLLEGGERFELILMDVTLGGGMCGLETASKIRSNPSWGNIPIIAVTGGLTIQDDIQKAKSYGCDAILTKPIEDEDLIKAVTQFVDS